jgi:hypothetical protein
MRKRLIALAIAATTVGALSATPAAADVTTTQHLPASACNQGTMNAHERIPGSTGTGATTPAHAAVRYRERETLRPRRLIEAAQGGSPLEGGSGPPSAADGSTHEAGLNSPSRSGWPSTPPGRRGWS